MTDTRVVHTNAHEWGRVAFECAGEFIQVIVMQQTGPQQQMYKEVLPEIKWWLTLTFL